MGMYGVYGKADDAQSIAVIHLDGEVHLALTTTLRDQLVAAELARPFVYDEV